LFIHEAIPRLDLIQYGQHAFSCVLVQACTSDHECSARKSEASTGHKQKPGLVHVCVNAALTRDLKIAKQQFTIC